MKKRTKIILSAFLAVMITVMIPLGLMPANAAGTKAVSSAVAPDDVIARTGDGAGGEATGDQRDNGSNKRILVIQTNSPWEADANEKVMKLLLDEGYICEYTFSSVLDSIYMDYTEYNMILIANDQNYENYRNYDKIKANIEKYVDSGGVVLFGACDGGWADGIFSSVLPGDVAKNSEENEYDPYNTIANAENPFVKGDFYTKAPLTDSMLCGNYCSHVAFKESTLPEGSDIILRAKDSEAPTLVKYGFGEGTVVASGLTWEFTYERKSSYPFGYYYPDIILYALSFSDDIIEKPASEFDSGFQIKIDSNNFCHTGKTVNKDGLEIRNPGFKGVKNYKMSDSYYNRLVNKSSRGEKSAIKNYINYGSTGRWSADIERNKGGNYWGGSCYGIATTMAMVFEKNVNLNDINDGNAASFFTMRYPHEDAKLLDTIQYFHVSQLLSKGGENYAKIAKTVNDTDLKNQEYNYNNLRAFLKTAVAEASSGHVRVFGFSTKEHGHAVLFTGCRYDPAANKYYIKIYDENSVSGLTGAKTMDDVKGSYSYMEVSGDYRFFSWEDYDLNNETYLDMVITDTNLIKQLDGSVNSRGRAVPDIVPVGDDPDGEAATPDEVDAGEHTFIICSAEDTFKITDSDGRTLEYNEDGISGDMSVYSISTTENLLADGTESAPYISFEVDASVDYTVTDITKTMDVKLYNDDNFMSIEGSNIAAATLSFDAGINLSGEEYSFTAFIDTAENVGEDENKLVSVSARAAGETKIDVADNKVNAQNESGLADVLVGEYVGSDYAVAEIDDSDSLDIGGVYDEQSDLVVGDVDGDGKVTVIDSTIIQRRIANIEIPFNFFNRIADADADNDITLMDATFIQKWIVKALSADNIGKKLG